MDNLEKFIKDNRKDFDQSVPKLKVWAAINSELDQPKKAKRISLWKYARMAAAVLVLLGTGAMLGNYFSNGQNQQASALSEVSPEYAELEQYYRMQVNQKRSQLAHYKYDVSINDDIGQLEKLMEDLMKELEEAPLANDERIINAMINNYQTRVAILERVLQRLQSNNQKNIKKEDNESIDI